MKLLTTFFLLFILSFGIAQTPPNSHIHATHGKTFHEAKDYFKNAENLYERGKYEQAIVLYSKAIELDPDYLNAHLRRGFCYSIAKDYEKAILDFDKVIELKPSHTWAYNSRGSAKNKLEKYDEAMLDFNKVLEIEPKNTEAYNNRGWAFKGKGDLKSACNDWKASKKMGNQEAKIILQNTHCK